MSGTSGGGGGDTITSNTSNITVNTGGTISITTNGTVANYFDTAGRLITPGISVTTLNGVSSTFGYFARRVGIGDITSPAVDLEISSTAGAGGEIRMRSTGSASDNKIRAYSGNTETGKIAFTSGSAIVMETAGTESMRILANGSVGIGTNAPSTTLHVHNPSGNGLMRISAASPTGYANLGILNDGNKGLSFSTYGTSYNPSGTLFGIPQANLSSVYSNAPTGMTIGTNVGGLLVLGTSNIERMRITANGEVGIGVSAPSSSLHVAGAVNFGQDVSATLNTCDANRAGAMRWDGTQFQVCYGSGGWALLSSAAISGTGGAALGDRITSGTTSVVAGTNGYISLTTGGVNTGYFDTAGRLVVPGISVTTLNGISSTTGYFNGNVGINTAPGSSMLSMAASLGPTANIYNIGDTNGNILGYNINVRTSGVTGREFSTSNNGTKLMSIGFINDNSTPRGIFFNTDQGGAPLGSAGAQMMLSPVGYMGLGPSGTFTYLKTPSSTLHVNGGIRLSQDASATTNTCDANRAGGIRWDGTQFQVCYGSGGWALLSSAAVSGTGGAAISDRITSGTTTMIASATSIDASGTLNVNSTQATGGLIGNFSILGSTDTAGFHIYAYTTNNATAYLRDTAMLYLPSTTRDLMLNAPSSTAAIRFHVGGSFNDPAFERMRINSNGYVGMGTDTPSNTLQVAGAINIGQDASATTNTCDANRAGAMRWNGTQFQVCYGSGGWALLSSAAVSGTGGAGVMSLASLTDVSASASRGAMYLGTPAAGNSSGNDNTAVGYGAMGDGLTTGNWNVALGKNALQKNTTGLSNMAIGTSALNNNTTGFNNVAIGTSAMLSNVTGTTNVALGTHALSNSSGSSYNLALGGSALNSLKTGDSNVAVGVGALQYNERATANTAVGTGALQYNLGTTAVAIGRSAGTGVASNTAVTGSVFIGNQSGLVVTNAERNTFVGAFSGAVVTSGDDNILIGYDVDTPGPTTSDRMNIGQAIYGDLALHGTDILGGAAKIGINFVTPTQALEVSGTVSATRFVGDGSLLTGIAGGGATSLASLTDVSASSAAGNLFAGTVTGAVSNAVTNTTALGYLTLAAASNSGHTNTALGTAALRYNTTGYQNTAMGAFALTNNTTGQSNSAYGVNSLYTNTTGNQNIAFGGSSLYSNTVGQGNTAMGIGASQFNVTGIRNNSFGLNTLRGNVNGSYNVAFGYNAVSGTGTMDVTGTTALGSFAGANLTTNANYNILIGYQAGLNLTTGASNILLGTTVSTPLVTSSNFLNIGSAISGSMLAGGSMTFIGGLKANGVVTATYFEGDGSRLTNIAGGSGGDRIVSGTSDVIVATNSSITFDTAGVERMIVGANGGVGIGTSTPSSTLHMMGTTLSMQHTTAVSSSNSVAAVISFRDVSGSQYGWVGDGSSSSNYVSMYDVRQNGGITLGVGSAARMYIASDGNIGIGMGVTAPSTSVDISGTVRAASTASSLCTASTYGSMRFNTSTGKPEICRPQ